MPKLQKNLLRDVSRSFYLTLRLLPGGVRPQIGLAYLLARTSDTIADTELVPPDQRRALLQRFNARIASTSKAPLDIPLIARTQASPAETVLLERVEESLASLEAMDPEDARLVREVLGTIISGQDLDMERFASASPQRVVCLTTDAELDDYTYRVAGCVGDFWTRICIHNLFPDRYRDESALVKKGIYFGQGLQLVNILRDLPADLAKGRCYLPREKLSDLRLSPEALRGKSNQELLRPLYHQYLERAEEYLRIGWDYTNALPRNAFRVRVACALPIVIGLKTLHMLRNADFLDPAQRIKVSRQEVKAVLRQTLWAGIFRHKWSQLVPPRTDQA